MLRDAKGVDERKGEGLPQSDESQRGRRVWCPAAPMAAWGWAEGYSARQRCTALNSKPETQMYRAPLARVGRSVSAGSGSVGPRGLTAQCHCSSGGKGSPGVSGPQFCCLWHRGNASPPACLVRLASRLP